MLTPPHTFKTGDSNAAALDDELSDIIFRGNKLSMQHITQMLSLT